MTSPKPAKQKAKRVGISPRTRFETFKRDGFKCQYCGAAPPDVILVVDHIRPVVDGGSNDITNLVTACKTCNAGKSCVLLSIVPKSLEQMAADVAAREAMIWDHADIMFASSLRKAADVQKVNDIFRRFWSHIPTADRKLSIIRNYNERIGVEKSCEAMDIAIRSPHGYTDERTFRYYCGICKRIAAEIESTDV